MRRRDFITLLGGAAAMPFAARAQQGEPIRRIGVLVGLSEDNVDRRARLTGFRQGLEKLGWTEGHNVGIETRYAPAGAQAQEHAQELVALQPDVILAQSPPIAAAVDIARASLGAPPSIPTRKASGSAPIARANSSTKLSVTKVSDASSPPRM